MFERRFLGHSAKKKMEKDLRRWKYDGYQKKGRKELFLSLFKKIVEGEVGILCALDYRNTTMTPLIYIYI